VEITIDSHGVLVKPNLFAALKELRSYFELENVARLTIWMDAICIDQVNEKEKAEQIRKMHSVFSGAVEVLVWLGDVGNNIRMVLRVFAWIQLYRDARPDLDAFGKHGYEPGYLESITDATFIAAGSLSRLEVDHGISLINLLAMLHFLDRLEEVETPLSEKAHPDQAHQVNEAMRVATDIPIVDQGLFPPDHVFWSTIFTLPNLEWLGRVWTFQEIKLARDARLLTQGVSVPWNTLLSSVKVLSLCLLISGTFNKERRKHLPPFPEMFESYQKWPEFAATKSGVPPTFGLPLLMTLTVTQHRVSTVANDNVYGLIALWPSKSQAEIVIDYTRETAEVFANAVQIGLKVEETASIAYLWAEFDRLPSVSATDGLPSWCPDFQYAIGPSVDVRHKFMSPAVRDRIKALACYEHTPGFETIVIRVLKLDTIAKTMTSACPKASEWKLEPYSGLNAWLQELLAFMRSENQADRSLGHDLLTFFYETASASKAIPWFNFDLFSKCVAGLIYLLPRQLADTVVDRIVYPTLDILSRQSGRFLFCTKSGRIGYSARQPCAGYHIVLVPGSEPNVGLHILTSDCTQYAGCASVLGWMGDSLLDSLDDMESKWEMVCLK
jgi:hypothetical protein